MVIDYVKPTKRDLYNTTSLTQFGGGGKKMGVLGKVLGVVAAIAVPFIAAPIATAIFGGASIMGSAIVGLGLGAAAGAGVASMTGGDVMQGALFGGVGGALGAGAVTGATGAGWMVGAGGAGGAAAGAAVGGPMNIIPQAAGSSVAPGTYLGASGTAAAGVGTGVAGGAPNPTGAPALGAATTSGGTAFKQITESLLRAAPQLIGQTVAQMSAPDQAEYLQNLEAEMEAYKGKDEVAYQQRLDLYNRFLAEASNADPQFQMRLAEAKVKREQALQYNQNMEALNLTGRTEEEQANEARRFAVEGTLAQHAAGVNANLGATQQQQASLARAAGVAPQGGNPNNVAYARDLYNIAGDQARATAHGAANTAQMLMQPFMYSNYRLGAPQGGSTAGGYNMYGTGMYGGVYA